MTKESLISYLNCNEPFFCSIQFLLTCCHFELSASNQSFTHRRKGEQEWYKIFSSFYRPTRYIWAVEQQPPKQSVTHAVCGLRVSVVFFVRHITLTPLTQNQFQRSLTSLITLITLKLPQTLHYHHCNLHFEDSVLNNR